MCNFEKAFHDLWLVAALFQMARMKITARVGWKRGPPGVPSGSTPLSPRELERRRRQLEGLEAVGRLPGSSLTQMLAKMVAEVGSSKTSKEANHVRSIVGGRPHAKSSLKEDWSSPGGTSWGQWLSARYASTKRVLSSSFISNPSCTCFARKHRLIVSMTCTSRCAWYKGAAGGHLALSVWPPGGC